jgi:hypothetical protein
MDRDQFQFLILMMCCAYCAHLSAALMEKGISDVRAAFPCAFALALLKWWQKA